VIRSFASKRTEKLWRREQTAFPTEIVRSGFRKLELLDSAVEINDLALPPGNRLEKLKGDRSGYYSIRINQQWRICFRWERGDAHEVDIVDYH
jgi:proteic killer suppression protein